MCKSALAIFAKYCHHWRLTCKRLK
jgi:hypothetical protein